MMKYLCCLATTLFLLSCKEKAATPNLNAAFNQDFKLRYAQSAGLPDQDKPELTVTVDDVQDNRCPPCSLPGMAKTVLSVRDQQGSNQTTTLCLGCCTALNDSVVVLANSRRYVLTLRQITPVPVSASDASMKKEDKQVTLFVKR